MSTMRRRGLQIDDPLGPAEPIQPDNRPVEAGATTKPGEIARRPADTTDHPSEEGQRREPEGEQDETGTPRHPDAPAPQAASREVWRVWSGITGVGSFRLPHELLHEPPPSRRLKRHLELPATKTLKEFPHASTIRRRDTSALDLAGVGVDPLTGICPRC